MEMRLERWTAGKKWKAFDILNRQTQGSQKKKNIKQYGKTESGFYKSVRLSKLEVVIGM